MNPHPNTQRKPDGISLGSLHKMNDRIVYCKELWFSEYNLVKVTLYECSTDKENEITYQELVKMLDEKTLILHTPEKGRILPRI